MLNRMVVKQQDEKDCGICCIKSLLINYDGYAPLEKIRQDTYTTKRGTSAFHMIECLKEYGFDAYGAKIKKERFLKEKFPLPAIVHVVLDNGLNHYMVLYEIRREKVILMDPATGKKSMGITDFFWIWSEVIIIAYPKIKIINCPKDANMITLFFSYLGNFKKEYLNLLSIYIFTYLMIIIGGYHLKFQIEFLNRFTEQTLLFVVFSIILFLKLLGMKKSFQGEYQLNKDLEIVHLDSFLKHLLKLPLKLFKSREYSDYLFRLWEQFDLKFFYTEIIKNSIISIGTIPLCFFVLYTINHKFFLLLFLSSAIYFVTFLFLGNKMNQQEKSLIEEKNKFANEMYNHLQSIEVFTHLNIKEKQEELVEKQLISFLRKKDEHDKSVNKYVYYQNALKEGNDFLLIVLGICAITKQKISLIDFLLIETLKNYLFNALEVMIKISPKFHYLKHNLKKSSTFLLLEEENLSKRKTAILNGGIEMNNVTFTYDKYNYILKDLKMKIEEGKHILLLGASGSGKSTLCKILTRNLKLLYGEIKIGQTNILDYDLSIIRSNIVYLPQKSAIINGTIKENIIMFREHNLKRFQEICKLCHIEEIVKKRPLRYETRINSQENDLSGGEKQRILLARTLMSKANIFLLDESLSEIDEKLEKDIIKNLRIFLKGKILIYISHKNYKKLFDETITLESCNERVLIP